MSYSFDVLRRALDHAENERVRELAGALVDEMQYANRLVHDAVGTETRVALAARRLDAELRFGPTTVRRWETRMMRVPAGGRAYKRRA